MDKAKKYKGLYKEAQKTIAAFTEEADALKSKIAELSMLLDKKSKELQNAKEPVKEEKKPTRTRRSTYTRKTQ